MNTEKIAVIAVEKEISRYDELSSYIATGDKEPMWDGNIYIYKEGSKKNRNKDFIGRISVQVKGKGVKKLINGDSKYNIKVEYLRGYQKEKKGTLLFVVEMVNSEETKIYYRNLLPVDLNNILKKVKQGDKTISIDIKPIKPDGPESLLMVCRYFLENSKLQMESKIRSIEELGNIKEIICPVISNNQCVGNYLFKNDFYYYAQVEGMDSQYVLDVVGPIRTAITNQKGSIKVRNKEFFQDFIIEKTKDEGRIILGKSAQMSIKTNEIKYKIQGNINERIKDTEFLIELFKQGEFSIDDRLIKLCDCDYKKYILNLENVLKALKNLKKLFQKFNIKFDKKLEQLDEKSIQNLNILRQINEGILHKEVEEMQVYSIKIDDICIVFFITVDSNKKSHLHNYFGDIDDKMIVHCVDKDNNSIRISPYINLTEKELTTFSNVNLEVMKKSFDKYEPQNEGMGEKYNFFMLELIKTYDKTGDLKWLEFAEHINGKNENFVEQPIYKINELQMIKRRRELTSQEIEELYKIRETQLENLMVQCAIAILLDNKSDFKRYFNRLDDESKEIFKQFPIYNFVKKSLICNQ